MSIKSFKPTTSSLRHTKLIEKKNLFLKKTPFKNLTLFKKNSGGRNNHGKITSYHKGGGCKQIYRIIDFKRIYAEGIVEHLEYDPNRTSYIARIYDYKTNFHYYILAPKNLEIGTYIQSGPHAALKIGNCLPIDKIPIGFLIHNILRRGFSNSQFIKSAGTFGQLIQRNNQCARIKLPSGEQRLIPITSCATIGMVSNEDNKLKKIGKAGRSRWLNKRPTVRGVAMNPVDHPHGGGEGKTSGGRPSVTPWGKPTKGQSTSKYKPKQPYILTSRKKKII
jgi:large subunit ribosomal protein L2